MNTDRRRRPYIPLDVDLFSGDGLPLYERFGHAGLVVWMAFLTACRKSSEPGAMHWRTDAEALSLMGLNGYKIPFSLSEFFLWTGQRHWTTTVRRRHGNAPATTRARAWVKWQPRAHRPANDLSDSQVNGHKRGSNRATHVRPNETDRAPSLPPEGVGASTLNVEAPLTSNAPSGSSASRPSGRVAAESSEMRVNGNGSAPPPAGTAVEAPSPPPLTRPDPAAVEARRQERDEQSPAVPAEFSATLDALTGRNRVAEPLADDAVEAERARQLAALEQFAAEAHAAEQADNGADAEAGHG